MAAIGGLQAIAPVPPASEMIDIILSGTMRRTPTVIRAGFNVSIPEAASHDLPPKAAAMSLGSVPSE